MQKFLVTTLDGRSHTIEMNIRVGLEEAASDIALKGFWNLGTFYAGRAVFSVTPISE